MQFPVRLAFAVTINKSQGQSLGIVGLDLYNPVFEHGQFYVSVSRGTNWSRVKVLLKSGEREHCLQRCVTETKADLKSDILWNFCNMLLSTGIKLKRAGGTSRKDW